MSIDDKNRGAGSSDKSPTKFKERPSDKGQKAHPENVRGSESPRLEDQDPEVERQQEGPDVQESDEIREKVRRTIPKPGHPGKPGQNPSEKGMSEKGKRESDDEDVDKEQGTAEGGI